VTRQTLQIDDRVYAVAFDDPQPRGRRLTVIVRGRAVDEFSGDAIEAPLAVEPAGAAFERRSSRMLVTPRRAEGGVVGLVGVPLVALPRVNAQAYQVGLRVSAAGYHPVLAVVNHGPVAGPPGSWVPADVGDVVLRRAATHVEGRVVAEGTPTAPIGGAQVRLVDAWRALPTPTAAPAPIASEVLSVSPPVYARRIAGGSSAAAVALTAVAGQDKRLLGGAAARGRDVRLSDSVGLAPGTLLRFEPARPDRAEVIRVALIDGVAAASGTPTLPAAVRLVYPLAFPHRDGDTVEVVGEAIGAANVVDVDAEPADRCLLLGGLAGIAGAQWVRLAGGPPPEYHQPAAIEVVTDAEGFYRLPAIDRLATVRLEASAATFTPARRDLRLEVDVPERSLDFVLS
jgi:hypothetical protein